MFKIEKHTGVLPLLCLWASAVDLILFYTTQHKERLSIYASPEVPGGQLKLFACPPKYPVGLFEERIEKASSIVCKVNIATM